MLLIIHIAMRYNIWFRAFFKDVRVTGEDIISGGPGEVPVGKSGGGGEGCRPKISE